MREAGVSHSLDTHTSQLARQSRSSSPILGEYITSEAVKQNLADAHAVVNLLAGRPRALDLPRPRVKRFGTCAVI